MKHSLSFREDNTFTIVQFTDIHWNDGGEHDVQSKEANGRSKALMERVMKEEAPDLVVFTGDVISAGNSHDPIASFREAVSVVEESCVPWAIVFGNHDTEATISRQQLMEVVEGYKYSVAESGPADIHGYGNYVLQVKDLHTTDEPAAAVLYFFDSGNVSCLPHVEGYDWIRRDQVNWYEQQSRLLSVHNEGTPFPALAFLHIPLPEYDEVWKQEVCYGNKYERVCCPPINTGLFAAMVEMGDVMGTFVGHDHVNDYEGTLHGIRLCYGRATGYNTYGHEDLQRGARIIRLRSGEREFESWLRLADGSVIRDQPEHHPNES